MNVQKNITYKLENIVLGQGAFGTVHLGTMIEDDGKNIITKKIALKEIPKNLDNDAEKSLSNEVNISSILDNSNIVRMLEIVEMNNKKYLAYELCNGGDLRRYMHYFKKFDEELIQIIVIKMLNGLSELHKKNVIHHDIKPENILIHLFYDKEITPKIEKQIEKVKEITKKRHNKNHMNSNNHNNNNNIVMVQNNYFNGNNQMNYNNNNFNQNMFNNNNFFNNNQLAPYNNMINYNNYNNNFNNNTFNQFHNNWPNNNMNYMNQNNVFNNYNANYQNNQLIQNNMNFNNNNNMNFNMNCNNNFINNNTNNNNQMNINNIYVYNNNRMNVNNNNYINNNNQNNLNNNNNFMIPNNTNNMNNANNMNNTNNMNSTYNLNNTNNTNNMNNMNYTNNMNNNTNNNGQISMNQINLEVGGNDTSNDINNPNNNDNIRINPYLNEEEEQKKEVLKILKRAQFKLSDFSLSKLKNDIAERNLCGSPLYMAPELFIPDTSLNSIENFQVDIWAFGVLVFEMFFGRRPFEAFSIEELSKMYKKGKYYINLEKNEKISKGLFNFINMCLQKDPRKRANVAKLQKSDFINQDIEPQIKSALNKEELMKQLGTSCEIDSNNNIVLDINKIYDL